MVAKKKTAKKTTAKKTTKNAVAAPKMAAPKVGGWWGNCFTNSGVLIAIFSALGIAAFFVGWVHAGGDAGFNGYFNGWELTTLNTEMREAFCNSWQTFIPVITFALSIVAFLTIILPAFGLRGNKIAIDAFIVILGITIFILSICFLFGEIDGAAGSGKFIKFLDAGFFLTIAASVVMILGGLRDATKH